MEGWQSAAATPINKAKTTSRVLATAAPLLRPHERASQLTYRPARTLGTSDGPANSTPGTLATGSSKTTGTRE